MDHDARMTVLSPAVELLWSEEFKYPYKPLHRVIEEPFGLKAGLGQTFLGKKK